MLRIEGWGVNHKRVERIWRQEGLKVPERQPKRGRLWLNEMSHVVPESAEAAANAAADASARLCEAPPKPWADLSTEVLLMLREIGPARRSTGCCLRRSASYDLSRASWVPPATEERCPPPTWPRKKSRGWEDRYAAGSDLDRFAGPGVSDLAGLAVPHLAAGKARS